MVCQDSTTPGTYRQEHIGKFFVVGLKSKSLQVIFYVVWLYLVVSSDTKLVPPNLFTKSHLKLSFRQNNLSHHNHHTHADQPLTTPLLHHEKSISAGSWYHLISYIIRSYIIRADKQQTVSYTFTPSPKSQNWNNWHFITNTDAKFILGPFVYVYWVQTLEHY